MIVDGLNYCKAFAESTDSYDQFHERGMFDRCN